MRPRNFPLTSVNHSCVRGTFQKVPYSRWTVCQLLSTFRVVTGSSINFLYNYGIIRQLSVRPWYLLSTFHTSAGHSVKFRQLFVRPSIYPSIFRASADSSVNFRQLSVHPRDLSSTFVHWFELPSSFRASAGHSVNVHEIVCPRNLP